MRRHVILRLIRNPELKGIIGLAGVALLLALVSLILTGKITEWTGIRFCARKPLTNAIVYVSNQNGHPDIWVMKPDGSEKKALTNDAFEDAEPVVTPDGYTIIYVSKHEGAYNQIYVMDSDGSHPHRLTQITGNKSGLSISQDGKSAIFLCAGSVWKAPLSEEHPDRLLPTEMQAATERTTAGNKSPFIWAALSHDGTAIAAVRDQEGVQTAFWMKPGDDMPSPVAAANFSGGAPFAAEKVGASWAPDSRKLILTASQAKGPSIIAVADMDAGQIAPMTVKPAIDSPRWSPDANFIVCQALNRKSATEYSPTGLLLFDLSAGKTYFVAPGASRGPSWSPDGGKVAFAMNNDIALLDREDKKATVLTDGKSVNSDPTWAPAPAKE